MNGLKLPAVLGPLVRSAADDMGRYSMNGVRVSDPQNGTFCCVVTDGRNLLAARGYCPDKGMLRADAAPDVEPAVIVPTALWNEAFRKTPRLAELNGRYRTSTTAPLSVESFTQDKTEKVRLSSDGRTVEGYAVDGRFPDWKAVIPQDKPTFVITVNPQYLAELLTTISRTLTEPSQAVKLVFWKPDVPMAIVVKDRSTGLCLDGLLMPITPDPEPVRREPEEEPEEDYCEWHCRKCGEDGYYDVADMKEAHTEKYAGEGHCCPECGSTDVHPVVAEHHGDPCTCPPKENDPALDNPLGVEETSKP